MMELQLNLQNDKFWQKMSENVKYFFYISFLTKIPKNFTQDYFDAIENLEKVTQVQWKSFSSLFYNLHPPCFAQKY